MLGGKARGDAILNWQSLCLRVNHLSDQQASSSLWKLLCLSTLLWVLLTSQAGMETSFILGSLEFVILKCLLNSHNKGD